MHFTFRILSRGFTEARSRVGRGEVCWDQDFSSWNFRAPRKRLKMASRNRKVKVKTYCVAVEVVQPVKRMVISVEAENTAGMFMPMSMFALECSLECECESESESRVPSVVLCHAGDGESGKQQPRGT